MADPKERHGFLTVLDTEKHRFHQCEICGEIDVWTKGWCWYGVTKTCSEECRAVMEEEHAKARKRVLKRRLS